MIAAVLQRVMWLGIKLVTGVRSLPPGLFGQGPGVLYANHSSHFDTLTVWAALDPRSRRRLRPVAARDYWGRPGFLGWVGRHLLRVLLIDRDGASSDPIADMADALDEGALLLLFPEGTRTGASTLGRFRSGLFRLAERAPDVPMYPMFLENPGRALPKGELVPIPILCGVRVGQPLTRQPDEDRDAFLARSRTALRDLAPTSFDEEAP